VIHGKGVVHKRALPRRDDVTVRFLVAISDQDAARRAVEAWHPGFNIIIARRRVVNAAAARREPRVSSGSMTIAHE
jgi:hypothetical protein